MYVCTYLYLVYKRRMCDLSQVTSLAVIILQTETKCFWFRNRLPKWNEFMEYDHRQFMCLLYEIPAASNAKSESKKIWKML